MNTKPNIQTHDNIIVDSNITISGHNNFYTAANLIIYILIVILVSFLLYDIFIIYRNSSTHIPPKNSINVSPNNKDNIHNVFIEN